MTFHYHARRRDNGNKTTGVVLSTSKAEAVKQIERLGLVPISVDEAKPEQAAPIRVQQAAGLPRVLAKKQSTAGGVICGGLGLILVLPAIFVMVYAPFLAIGQFVLGCVLLTAASRTGKAWVCSECQNRVDGPAVRICPVCREQFHAF